MRQKTKEHVKFWPKGKYHEPYDNHVDKWPFDITETEQSIIKNLREKELQDYEIEFIDRSLQTLPGKKILHALWFIRGKDMVGAKKAGRKSKVSRLLYHFEREDFDKNDSEKVKELTNELFDYAEKNLRISRATKYRFVAELRKKGYPTERIVIK